MADDVLPADEAARIASLHERCGSTDPDGRLWGECSSDCADVRTLLAEVESLRATVARLEAENEHLRGISDHDTQCESEFVDGPMAFSPCGCADRAIVRLRRLEPAVARLRTAADDLLDDRFNEGFYRPEDALCAVADWLETPRFADMSDGEVEHDLRLIAGRLEALRAALDATTAEE